MTKKLILTKGYTVTVESFENDGDIEITDSITLETAEEVQALVDFLEIFHDDPDGEVANLFEPNDDELELFNVHFDEWVEKHKDVTLNTKRIAFDIGRLDGKSGEEFTDGIQTIAEFVSLAGAGSGDYFSRAVDKYSVTYSESDVYVDDVTDRFV